MVVNATSVARVKAHMPDTSSGNDTVYQALIDAVSREFEKYLGYELEAKSRVEFYSPEINDRIVFLRQRPVASIALVRVATPGIWDFAANTVLVANQHYRLSGNDLWFYSGLIYGRDTLEITYTAGLGANDAAVIAAAPDLALAADIQVCEEFRRRSNPATLSRPGPGGKTKTYAAPHGLLPRVAQILGKRRRMVFEGVPR